VREAGNARKVFSQLPKPLDKEYLGLFIKFEKGKHMLEFPEEALKRLNNKTVNNIWTIIKREIKKELGDETEI